MLDEPGFGLYKIRPGWALSSGWDACKRFPDQAHVGWTPYRIEPDRPHIEESSLPSSLIETFMIVLLSPAKTLDWDPLPTPVESSTPQLSSDAWALVKQLRNASVDELKDLMSLSDKLATLNAERYQDYRRRPAEDVTRPAVMAFAGDSYRELYARDFDAATLAYAQQHLRILSGLYGVLRPLDAIQPYRLEMGTKLATERGKNLYAYWGDRITKALNKALEESHSNIVLNLASKEYVKSVNTKQLNAEMVTPVFKEYKKGTYKTLALFAKRARGAMTHFVLTQQVRELDTLRGWTGLDYTYSEDSKPGELLFLRRREP